MVGLRKRIIAGRFHDVILLLSMFSLWDVSAFLTNLPIGIIQHDTTHCGPTVSRREFSKPLAIMAQNATGGSEGEKQKSIQISFGIQDQRLLACDLVAILIASQLMGLVDAVNDPDFSRNGGWLQPIPAVPSTLNALIEKISVVGLFWFPSSMIRLQVPSSSSTFSPDESVVNDLGEVLPTVALFCIFRIGVAVILSNISHVDFDLFPAIRDCYFVGLATISFRFLYSQYFR